MKKIISVALMVSMAFSNVFAITSFAEETGKVTDLKIGDITFTLNSDKNLIVDYKDAPSYWVDINSLNLNTYYNEGKIESVEFSKNVKNIPDKAFAGLDKITALTIPSGVEYIGENAFDNVSVNKVVIPDTVKTVEKNAFLNCDALKDITVKSDKTQIMENAFGYKEDADKNIVKVSDVKITASENSEAKKYADKSGIAFVQSDIKPIVNSNISYELNGGTNYTDAPLKYEEGKDVVLGTPVKEKNRFTGWYVDTNADNTPDTKISKIEKTQTGDVKLYATWAPVYEITYELAGGTNYASAPKDYSSIDGNVKLGTPTKDGYVFTNWSIDKNGDGIGDFMIADLTADVITNDTKLFAMWQKAYKITYELNGGTNPKEAPVEFTADTETIILKNPQKGVSSFAGWYTDPAFKAESKITEIKKGTTADVKIYAKWDEVYKITFELNDGHNYSGAPTTYTADTETIKLGTPTKQGYKFYKWYKDPEFKQEVTEIPKGSTGDITLYATWVRLSGNSLGGIKYFVHFDSDGGTEIDSLKIKPKYTAKKPENPTKKGYTFAGWYTEPTLENKFDFTTPITKHTTLYAKWIKTDEYDDPILDGVEYDIVMVLTIDKTEAKVNGKVKYNDVAPIIRNGRTMMPIRFIAENLGAQVEWNGEFRIVTVKIDGKQIVLHIGSDIAYINGEVYELDSEAFISEDRTYIPVKFVAEALECTVDWADNSRKVIISK